MALNLQRRKEDACKLPDENDHHLLVLKKATPELKKAMEWSDMIMPISEHDHQYTRLESESGVIFYKILHWSVEKSVMDNVAAAGSSYKKHLHSGIEIFQVYKGELIICYNGDEIKVKSINKGGKPYYIDSGVEHWGYCDVDTEFLATTIPGIKSGTQKMDSENSRGISWAKIGYHVVEKTRENSECLVIVKRDLQKALRDIETLKTKSRILWAVLGTIGTATLGLVLSYVLARG